MLLEIAIIDVRDRRSAVRNPDPASEAEWEDKGLTPTATCV